MFNKFVICGYAKVIEPMFKVCLRYNAKQSFSLCFVPRTVKINRPQLYLDTLEIPHLSECKYLGIFVGQNNCDSNLKRQMKFFYTNANMLLRRFSKCSIPVKYYLFKTYCSNLYCAPLWYNFTLTAMGKIKIYEQNITVLVRCL